MSWTANVDSVAKDSAGVSIHVTFTSDDQPPRTLVLPFHFQTETPDDVQNAIQNQIDLLTSQDTLLAGVPTGPFQPPTPVQPVQPTPPTPQQNAIAAYQLALSVRQQVVAAIAAGGTTAGSSDDTGSIALIQSAYPLGLLAYSISDAQNIVDSTPLPAGPPNMAKVATK